MNVVESGEYRRWEACPTCGMGRGRRIVVSLLVTHSRPEPEGWVVESRHCESNAVMAWHFDDEPTLKLVRELHEEFYQELKRKGLL